MTTTVSAANQPSDKGPALHLASAPAPSAPPGTPARPAVRPSVSLVIPVRNEARNVGWVLEQIANDVDEILIVDGDSTDVTLITARSYRPDVRVVPQQGKGKGSAL